MGVGFIPVWEIDFYLARPEFEFIDVRSCMEYAEGHLCHARNLPIETIEVWKNDCFGGKTPIFYCYRGSNSLKAAMQIVAQGRNAIHVSGGIYCYRGGNWIR